MDYIAKRRRQIERIIDGLTYLIDNAYDRRDPDQENVVMSDIDSVCVFSPEEYREAQDMIFNASDIGIIPDYVVGQLSRMRSALRHVVTGYTGSDHENYVMWSALAHFFEFPALEAEADKYAPCPDCEPSYEDRDYLYAGA